MKNLDLVKIGVIIYAVSIAMIPPLKTNGKYVFFTEIFLLPFFAFFFMNLLKGKVKFNKPFLIIILAFVFAYLSGVFRGDLGNNLNTYPIANFEDNFSYTKDLIKFFRWSGMFVTPFVIFSVLQDYKDKTKLLDLFLNTAFVTFLVSAVLCILDGFHIIQISNLFPFLHNENWPSRSYGTLSSPLEGSLIYVLGIWLAFRNIIKTKNYGYVAALAIFFIASFFTKTLTSYVALIGCVIIVNIVNIKNKLSDKRLWIFSGLCILTFFIIYENLPRDWVQLKLANFMFRTQFWTGWLELIQSTPRILITGIGFSTVVVDNSFLMLMVYGGLVLFTAAIYYFRFLFSKISAEIRPALLIWILSWVTLDSIGYWGIGRFCWFALGLAMFQAKKTKAQS